MIYNRKYMSESSVADNFFKFKVWNLFNIKPEKYFYIHALKRKKLTKYYNKVSNNMECTPIKN